MTLTVPPAFRSSLIVTVACLALAIAYGWSEIGTLGGIADLLWIIAVLAVLEVSLSFDNAVVNASVMGEMEPVWQRRFLTWGMAIAVFGTRVVFPLTIVGVATGLGPVEALRLSLDEPSHYEEIVRGAHVAIAGFGGAFLILVGLGFFMNADKDVHWLGWVERRLARAGTIKAVQIGATLVAILVMAAFQEPEAKARFIVASLIGVIAFIAVEGLGVLLEGGQHKRQLAGATVKSGLGAFLYLNVLDASFSLDGVIGAFALSDNMVVIALGLTIGAVFVRSLTVLMVEKQTLGEYRYLEHGAFWAILALGAIMLISTRVEVPEVVTGLVGAVLIGASVWGSVRHARKVA